MGWLTLRYIDADGEVHHHGGPREAHLDLLPGLSGVRIGAHFPAPTEPLVDTQWFVGLSDCPYDDPLKVEPLVDRLTSYAGDTIFAYFTMKILSIDGVEQEVSV